MALPLRAALRSAGRFMVKNPTTMLSMARHALGMRIAVPLDALRWFIANTPPSKKAPQDVTITPRPPAIGLGATVDLMGTTVRAGRRAHQVRCARPVQAGQPRQVHAEEVAGAGRGARRHDRHRPDAGSEV